MKDRETKQVGKPSKYQEIAERLAKDLKADVVVLAVVNGRHGSGMPVCTNLENAHYGRPDVLAAFLRNLADNVELGQPEGMAVTTFEPRGEG